MKKLTSVAVALMAATSAAQAAEVFKNDTQSVDLYGRVYAGQFMGTQTDTAGTKEGSEKYGANQFIRFGAKGDAAIGEGMKAIAQYEVQMNLQNTEKNISDDAGNLRTRLAYAGVKSDDFGQVTFGRQKGAISSIADWTDVALSDGYGASALGNGSDNFATGRASNVLKYSHKFVDALQLDASYKFDGNKTEETSVKSADAAYGLAASYALPMNLSIGAGYNVGLRDQAGKDDAKLLVAGLMYDDKAAYAALTYADGSDFVENGIDHSGWEAALGYNFDNGFGLMALYNLREEHDKVDNVKYDQVDYYTLGAQYKFNKNLRVIGEYRFQNVDASVTSETKNDYQLAARYDF